MSRWICWQPVKVDEPVIKNLLAAVYQVHRRAWLGFALNERLAVTHPAIHGIEQDAQRVHDFDVDFNESSKTSELAPAASPLYSVFKVILLIFKVLINKGLTLFVGLLKRAGTVIALFNGKGATASSGR